MIKNNPLSDVKDKIGVRAAEAAQIIGVSRSTFYQLHTSGRLPLPRHLGRCTVWDRRELEAWFAAGCPERSRWETMKGGVR